MTYREEVAAKKKREFRDETYWGRPVRAFGDEKARLLVVGLAPAAHGGNRTGRIFTGDSSGDWLFEALHRFGFANQPLSKGLDDGLQLADCYVTAAARCAPPDNKPAPEEFRNCRRYLEAELSLLTALRVIVALGRLAHENFIKAAGSGERPPFSHGAEFTFANGLHLISSFHPSRQNTNTRRLTREMWHTIFRRARELLNG